MFNSGLDIVVIARNSAADLGFKDVESALLHIFKLHKIYDDWLFYMIDKYFDKYFI